MFVIPESLELYSVHGLKDLAKIADQELQTLIASIANPADATEDQLDRGEALRAFSVAVDTEIQKREGNLARFAKMATPNTPPKENEDEGAEAPAEGDDDDKEEGGEYATSVQVTTPTGTQLVSATITKGGAAPTPPSVAAVAGLGDGSEALPVRNSDHYTIVAGADLGLDLPANGELGWDRLGEAFEARVRSYPTKPSARRGAKFNRLQHTFALVRREFPETQQLLDNDGEMSLYKKLTDVANRASSQVAESLTAAVGWCAPSETIYSICNPVTAEGLLDLPEVVARRGGIRHNQGIDWVTFFGGTFPALDTNVPGMSILTEAQVIADTAKTCLEIDCPPFVDDRLNVAALCLTGSLLQNRGYPEYVSEFTQGAMAAFAHFVNREVIDILEDGSTAVNLAAANTFGTIMGTPDTVSQIMSAVDFAATDIRTRMRLGLNAPIEIVLPQWIKVYMRADWMRRNAVSDENLTDAMISAMFATRNVRVQYVYDWQDAFSAVAGGAGATTPAVNFLLTATGNLRFLAYAPGTWILARQDVIRLDTVYDSVNLQQNLVTQLFMEDGFLPMRMCPQGMTRVYTVPTCASGVSGGAFTADCNVTA